MTRVLTAADVDAASVRLHGIVERTPLQLNVRLSALTGADVWVKREDLQPVRSYKLRGAYNRIAQLTDEERAAGVVCASAGNHGQGVAFACQRLGINGRIFVPSTTPRQKRDRMVAIGGDGVQLVVSGDTYDEAAAAATPEIRKPMTVRALGVRPILPAARAMGVTARRTRALRAPPQRPPLCEQSRPPSRAWNKPHGWRNRRHRPFPRR